MELGDQLAEEEGLPCVYKIMHIFTPDGVVALINSALSICI